MNAQKNPISVFLAPVQTPQEAFNASVHPDLFYQITGEDVMVCGKIWMLIKHQLHIQNLIIFNSEDKNIS